MVTEVKDTWENIPLSSKEQEIAIKKLLEKKKFNSERSANEFIAFNEKIGGELSDVICIAPAKTFKKDSVIFKIGYIFKDENGNDDVRPCEGV